MKDQAYIGLPAVFPIYGLILVVICTTAATVFYFYKKTWIIRKEQVVKQKLIGCCRSKCCIKRARILAEPLYDVPDYYATPPLPPRNKIPTTKCNAEYEEVNGNRDESLQQLQRSLKDDDVSIVSNVEANNNTASLHPLVDLEEISDDSRVPRLQENVSYLPSTSVSHLTTNPAYGTNIAIAPEILTEQNKAYESVGERI